MDLERIAVLLGQQRTGTHMLGDMIGSHPDVKYTGEIFWSHKRARDWDDMVAKIDRVSGGGFPLILIDVKYNQITDPVARLLPQVKVIQIIRRDAERLYYSGELHSFVGDHPGAATTGRRFRVDWKRFHAIKDAQDRGVNKWARVAGLVLHYEDITQNRQTNIMPGEYSRQVCEFLGIELRSLTTGTLKEGPEDIKGLLL